MQEMKIQVKATEDFLEKYPLIFTQLQIPETPFHCLPTKNKKTSFFSKERKFKDISDDILGDVGGS